MNAAVTRRRQNRSSGDCIFPKMKARETRLANTTTRFNTYICCFDPFCFSRQFHTTLINHQSDNLWLNDYCCCCCCRISGGNEKKDYNEKSTRGWLRRSIECSFILISHAHPLSLCFAAEVNDKCDFSVVDNAHVCCSSLKFSYDLYHKSFR